MIDQHQKQKNYTQIQTVQNQTPKTKNINKKYKKRTCSQSEEDQFRITKTQYSKIKLNSLKDVKQPEFIPGLWSYKQNKTYLKFLKKNKRYFKNEETRRNKTVFQILSKEIPTRSSQQCRSHHQKLFLKYQKGEDPIGKIIQSLESKLVEQQFQNQQKNDKPTQNQKKNNQERTKVDTKSGNFVHQGFLASQERNVQALKLFINLEMVEVWP